MVPALVRNTRNHEALTYYDDLQGSRDDARRVGWRDPLEQAFRYELVYQLLSEGSVLDVGCGMGDLCGFLRSRGFEGAYHGVDLRCDFVEVARARWGDHFEECDIREFDADFDWVVAIGTTIGDERSLTMTDLDSCTKRCGGRGIYLVLEESSPFDPALKGASIDSAYMRPLRGEALVLSWPAVETLDVAAAFRSVVRSVPSTAGERARLAFNAGLFDEVRSELEAGPHDALLRLIDERLGEADRYD